MPRTKYATEAERRAARVESTLRCRAKRNKEEYNTYMREFARKRYPELRIAVFNKLGNKCSKCGYDTDSRALQIDHIAGDGRQEKRRIGWWNFYNKILKDSTGYQLLCANCNYIKRYDNEEVYFVDPRLKSQQKEL